MEIIFICHMVSTVVSHKSETFPCFRCGIMHARGVVPSSRVTPTELEDYCATFEKKMGQ